MAASFPKSFWALDSVHQEFQYRDAQSFGIGKAIRESRVILIDNPADAQAANEYTPFSPEVGSEIIAPVLDGETIRAVFILSRLGSNPFSPRDTRLCEAVCDLLSLVYNNNTERERRDRRIDFLKRVSSIHSADFDEVIASFLSSFSILVPARFASFWLHNRIDDTLVIRAFSPSSLEGRPLKFDKTVLDLSHCTCKSVIKTGQASTFSASRNPRGETQRFADLLDLSWFLSLPIEKKPGDVLGVVNLYPHLERSEIGPETLEIMAILASQMGRALEVSETHRRQQIQAAFDSVFFDMLRNGDTRENWDNLATIIARELACEGCSLFFLTENKILGLRGSTGIEGNPSYDRVKYNYGEGLTGSALAQNQPVIYYRDHADRHKTIHKSKFRERLASPGKSRSIVAVPMLDRGGIPTGIIRCNNKLESPISHSGRFTQEDVQILQLVGVLVSDLAMKTRWLREQQRKVEGYVHSLHHEILSPVDGILTQMDWLQREVLTPLGRAGTRDPELVQRRANDIVEAARQIEMIIKSIGALDEDVKPIREDVDFLDLLYTARGWLTHEARRASIQIDVDYIADPLANVDKRQAMRVLYNVLQNALKYVDERERNHVVKIRQAPIAGRFVLEVEDNGIGVLPEDVERIFGRNERGVNAKRVYPAGAGLGLAFCRKILLAHGGNISVKKLAKPTIFQLDFGKQS